MGSSVSLLPVDLVSTNGIAICGWLVVIIGALGPLVVYTKMSLLGPSPGGSYAYVRCCFGPFLGYQTNILYRLACRVGNIIMAVIGVGYLSYFFPILKDPLVLTIICVVVLWIFVLLNIASPKMIARIQVLTLTPIVRVVIFDWFWLRGEAYMAAWNVSGLDTFDAIQNTLSVTLWSFIGVESASVAASMVKNPKRNVPIATIGGILAAAVCCALSTTAIMGMIPNATLCVSASPFGGAARVALGDTAGIIASFCATTGRLGSLGSWTLLAGQTAKAVADDGLFPLIFVRVNKAGTPVVGLTIVGILMTIFQLSSISPNATREFGLVSFMSVIFTSVLYLYTCAALLLLGHGHFGKARPTYLATTTAVFFYCTWAVVGSGAREVIWSFATLIVVTAIYALNYNRLRKNSYSLDTPMSKD